MDPKILPASLQTRPYAVVLEYYWLQVLCHRKLGESAELVVLRNWSVDQKHGFSVCTRCKSCVSIVKVFCHVSLIICIFLWFVYPPLSSSLSPLYFCLFFYLPQTNIGSILAAVNPYKQIAGLYDGTAVDLYSKHQMGELPPHIFAVANECYRCLWKRHDSQCVLIRWASTLKWV